MPAKTTGKILDTSKDGFDTRADAATIVAQIGRINILGISGGRVIDSGHGIILPVGSGYKVTVDLAGNDTYTVRRIRVVGSKVWLYGEVTGVYCDQVGDTAWRASCYRTCSFGE